ncbi:MAG: CrcB family protein [Gemmataceae bacterium]
MQKFLLIAMAGAMGSLCRWGVGELVQKRLLANVLFPWGTFTVNALGCFLFGLVWPLAEDRLLISSETRQIILTGFMGAFTTFSTFIFETNALAESREWLMAGGNLFGQIVVGILFLMLGLIVGRLL